ncbi:MAG: tyrosine-type recombinase/integrase [Ruminococcus sp.]
MKNSTYNSYQKYYKGAISKRLGKKNIADIRGEHIQSLYNNLVEEEWALSSIKVVAAVLNGCFQQALKNGLIERNPVKLAELPSCRKSGRKDRAMTKEQQALFMEYAKESYLYNFFAVMLRTGMRSGELKGLKYTDIG